MSDIVGLHDEEERAELTRLAADTALDVRAYLEATTTVASGTSPDVALPVVLLAISQVLVAGARLGAIADVLPTERFEPDSGPEPDVDPLHDALANVLNGIDEYADEITLGRAFEGRTLLDV